jgi:hypothetical protein
VYILLQGLWMQFLIALWPPMLLEPVWLSDWLTMPSDAPGLPHHQRQGQPASGSGWKAAQLKTAPARVTRWQAAQQLMEVPSSSKHRQLPPDMDLLKGWMKCCLCF